MKNTIVKALVALAILPAFAEDYLENPIVVTMTSVRQESQTQDLVVDYTLANHPGIVRMDVLTNGVSISEHLVTLEGDWSATEADVVQPGARTIRWRARRDWPANMVTNALVRLSAYYTNQIDKIPGVYMKVDLNDGEDATSYPVTYTFVGPSTNASGQASNTDDISRYLWLRFVGSTGPTTFTQGSTTIGSLIDNARTPETVRSVTLSEGFFAGVFPVTQAQYVKVKAKTHASGWQSGGGYAPVNYVSYNEIRTRGGSASGAINWPSTGHNVGTNSFLYALRSRTGLEFDLPTEAQWEFLCRAGTDSDFNDGSNLSPTNYYVGSTLYTNTVRDVHLDNLGWYKGLRLDKAQRVGQKKPNAWGLYDCHGNVWEWCLDHYGALSTSPVTDPTGASSGDPVVRGGSWMENAANCRSAKRQAPWGPTTQADQIGFRIVCPIQ